MRATWPNNKDNSKLAVFWPAQKITGKRVWQRHYKANVQDFSKWLTREMNKVFLYGSDSINKNKHYWINHIKETEQQNDKEVENQKSQRTEFSGDSSQAVVDIDGKVFTKHSVLWHRRTWKTVKRLLDTVLYWTTMQNAASPEFHTNIQPLQWLQCWVVVLCHLSVLLLPSFVHICLLSIILPINIRWIKVSTNNWKSTEALNR